MTAVTPMRPWGHLPFLLGHMRPRQWALLGCLSAEERSLGAFETLVALNAVGYSRLFGIADAPGSRYAGIGAQRRAERMTQYVGFGGSSTDVEVHALLEIAEDIRLGVERFLTAGATDIMLDITSFPKRFFFPIVRWLLESSQVQNLVITYTEPLGYTSEPLSEDPQPVAPLPVFAGRYPPPEVEVIVVGLGFQPLGLHEMLQGSESARVHPLYAYPIQTADRRRVWQLMRSVSDVVPRERLQIVTFVSPREVSDVFDYLISLTDGMRQYAALAPYGPKPMSLAMALAAQLAHWPVYYTQPEVYNPGYSYGIKRLESTPATFGHCIRLDGRDLYTSP